MIHSSLFRQVTIVGVGLMGGSLGMAIKKHGLAREVVGLSNKESSLSEAVKIRAIDTAETDVARAVRPADCVILATPVDVIIRLLSVINPYLKRGCLLTDVGSTKVDIIEASEKMLSHPDCFVGSHPLSGSEKKGIESASAELFENCQCILTPSKYTNQVVREKIRHLWTKIGCRVIVLSAAEHDETLAYTSHLPHLLAYGLMETIPPEFMGYVSQGFKDTSRIAASSPQVWNDICMTNASNVIKGLDKFVKQLSYLRKSIINKDAKALVQHFTRAKEKRDLII